jgi:hypothetical protein
MKKYYIFSNTRNRLHTTILDEHNTFFVPIKVCGDEAQLCRRVVLDHVPILTYQNSVFAPASWIAKQFPCAADELENLADSAKKIAALLDEQPYITVGHRFACVAYAA